MDKALIEFIDAHQHDDVAQLLLKQKEILGYPTSFVANQINGRKRAQEKLPAWFSNKYIVYPPQTNLEQCSSEATAKFKSEILKSASNQNSIADLTGGFGIDSFFFSEIFEEVVHVDPDEELIQLAQNGHTLLGAHNIRYVSKTAEDFMASNTVKFDWIYLDPSRKSDNKKVVQLSDSMPDVIKLLPLLFSKSDNILIKSSPLLDLKQGLSYLAGAKKIFVVSVHNECKEVLFQLEKHFSQEPQIVSINIPFDEQRFEFYFSDESKIDLGYSDPKLYLYEPNASLLKAGAFKSITQKFDVNKISTNTHFYTSQEVDFQFPGRIFKILGDIKNQRILLPDAKANVLSRNHPLSTEQIKKKFKIKDGGDRYVLAFSGVKKKFILIAERLK